MIDEKNIKEVSLLSHDSECDSLLRISIRHISFKNIRKKDGRELNSWSIKKSNDFGIKYDLVRRLINEFDNHSSKFTGDSKYSFNLRVTLKDDSHIDIHENGSFVDNGMSELAIEFIRFFPCLDDVPKTLSVFKAVQMDEKTVLDIDNNKIVGYFFGGDMGRIGSIDILTSDFRRYYNEGYGGIDVDLSKVDFPHLQDREISNIDEIEYFKYKKSKWLKFYLGFGNFLLMEEHFFRLFGDLILSSEYPNMYGKYNMLIEI